MSESSTLITDSAKYLKQGESESLGTAERVALPTLTAELREHLSLRKRFQLDGGGAQQAVGASDPRPTAVPKPS
jgi:hypothetical protein